MSVVEVDPGESIQDAIDGSPVGQEFLLTSGIHRLTGYVTPKASQEFGGEAGTIINGSRIVTGWISDAPNWYVTGETAEQTGFGTCEAGFPRCFDPHDLWMDDVRLVHVEAIGDLDTGKWFWDYDNDRIYVRDDPTSALVEVTEASDSFRGAAANSGVTIHDMILEKFRNQAQHGAIHCTDGVGWWLENLDIRKSHGVGLRVGAQMQAWHCWIHHHGQLGIGGAGASVIDWVLIDDLELSYNTQLGYLTPEYGGSKFVYTNGLIVRNSYVHHNNGSGLWLDIDNINALLEDNVVTDNTLSGIFQEIGGAAIIRRNRIARNGANATGGWYGPAGVRVAASNDVEVYENDIYDNYNAIAATQQDRGSGIYGEHLLVNLYAHDNRIRQTTGVPVVGWEGGVGVAQDVGDNSIFTTRGLRFENNHYEFGDSDTHFGWTNDGYVTFAEWRAFGHDTRGSARIAALGS